MWISVRRLYGDAVIYTMGLSMILEWEWPEIFTPRKARLGLMAQWLPEMRPQYTHHCLKEVYLHGTYQSRLQRVAVNVIGP